MQHIEAVKALRHSIVHLAVAAASDQLDMRAANKRDVGEGHLAALDTLAHNLAAPALDALAQIEMERALYVALVDELARPTEAQATQSNGPP